MSEEAFVEIEIDDETRLKLDKSKRKKPDGTLETDNEVLTRLLDNFEKHEELLKK